MVGLEKKFRNTSLSYITKLNEQNSVQLNNNIGLYTEQLQPSKTDPIYLYTTYMCKKYIFYSDSYPLTQ